MQSFLASLKGVKIKGLDEILMGFEERPSFDKTTDALLEQRAFERLEEMKRGRQ